MSGAQVILLAILITLWGATNFVGSKIIERELANIEASRGCK